MEIDCHVTEGTFVETNVIRRFKKWMHMKDVFVIIGAEGTGKSRNGLEILRLFGLTDENFDLLKVTDFQQVKDILTDERKTVVLLDDVLPFKECSCKCLINYHILDLLNARKCKGDVKIIFTLNSSKMNSFNDLLASHRLFKNCCKIDLSSIRFCMSEDEKATLMFNFCKQYEIDITWDSSCSSKDFYLDGRTVYEIAKTDPYIGYPKSCFMFTSNKRILQLGINFFKHPDQSLMDEINSFRDSTDMNLELNVSYALLVYALLNTGCLEINKIDIPKLETIMNSFGNSQRRRLFNSKLKKIAEQMDGRFLKQDTETMVYHFKHPMIYEALAISYFEVNPSEVISVLSWDFIIDLIKLELEDLGKQEISLIIAKELFGHLTKQIFTLFEKDYKMRSAEFIKTLCGSTIILQNNPDFLGLLIREFNNCTSQDTIDIQIEGRRDQMSFNFPRALLWYLIQKYNVDKHIATVLHFIENDIKDKQNLEKVKASKKVILACFYYICEMENNSDMKFELIYGLITECGIECSYDFSIQVALKNGNDPAVSFLLSHVSKEIDIVKLVFEVEHEEDIKRLCDLISTNLSIECIDTDNKTDILKFLCRSLPMNFFNLRKSIKTACNRLCKDLVTDILIYARPLSFDTENIVNIACAHGWEDALKIVLNRKLCNQNEKKQIFIASCKDDMDTFLKWMLLTVDKYVLDVQEFLLEEFRCENFETVKNFILKLQNYKEMETMIKKLVTQFNLPIIRLIHWVIEDTDNQIDTGNKNDLQSLFIVQWIYDRFPNLQINVRNTVYKTINDTINNSDEILQWLRENTKTIFHPITSLLEFSCKHDHQRIVKRILQTFDHNKFNMHELIIDAYELGYHKTAEVIISKVDLNKVDVPSIISAMLSICQNNWSKDLFLFLIHKLTHTYCKWMEIITRLIDLELYDYIELILQHVDNYKIDMMKIVKNKMNVLSENKLKNLIQSIKRELLDINYIVWTAFKIGYHEIVAWSIINDDQNAITKSEVFHAAVFNGNTNVTQYLLENIDHTLLDIKTAMDIACRRGKFDIIEMLLLNVDDEALCYFMRTVFIHGSLNVIRLLIDNIDISLIDLGAAMNEACRNGKSELVKQLIESYNDTVDLNRLIKKACDRNWLHILNSITQNVGISIFDLNTAMIEACRFRRMDIVRLLIQNNKYIFFDFTTVITDACRDRHIEIVETLVHHVDHNLLGMNDVIDHACRSDNLEQVKWLLGNIDNKLFDMKTTMNNACYEGMLDIVKWLIKKVDNKLFDMKEAMNRACVWGKLDIVKWLIENVDNELFDMKEAMNRACVWGKLDIVKWLIENVDNKLFDMKRAMNNVCYTGELDIVKWLIGNVDNKLFDMKVAMNDACVWEKLDIVKWLIDNVDNELFDMNT